MTRRRSSAPGCVRPDRRRSLLIPCLALVFVAAACIGPRNVTQSPSEDVLATEPAATLTTGPSDPPASTPAQVTPDPVTPAPVTPEPASSVPSSASSSASSSAPGPVTACTGTDDNREFFASIAEVVSWPVYCAVLPSGWFVDAGQYRLAGGGWLEIAYRGPGTARLELREGTACADQSCLPSGEDLGPASFGDLAATLVRLDDRRLAVVVQPIDGATWVAIGSDLEPDAVAAIAPDLARVGD